WDGGNNDFSFYKPDLLITLADPHRPGHEVSYYPGEVNARMADILIINKEKTAKLRNVETVRSNLKRINPRAVIIDADSEIVCKAIPSHVRSVLVVEDGPTLTHGGMRFGAGTIAAQNARLKIIDPRKYAVGLIRRVYDEYMHLGPVLPAMGYSAEQLKDLEETINATPADAVINASPQRIEKLISINKPVVEVTYSLRELSGGTLKQALRERGFI
ncbi:GTPase, partial [archaeon]|nr:GTPase [archaeon]